MDKEDYWKRFELAVEAGSTKAACRAFQSIVDRDYEEACFRAGRIAMKHCRGVEWIDAMIAHATDKDDNEKMS